MSDTAYPTFQHYGTAAERAAFTPAPASGTQPVYIWYETDTDNIYIYTTAWKGPFKGGSEKLISEVVTSSSATSISFTSIPAVFRDLRLVVRGRSALSALTAFVILQFNSDTGANYDSEEIYVITPTSSNNQNTERLAQTAIDRAFIPGATATANAAGTVEYNIFDYRGTTFHKNLIYNYNAKWNTTTGTIVRGSGMGFYRATTAISRIDLTLQSGSAFVDNSVASLYGRI